MNHLIALAGALGISLAAILFRLSGASPATGSFFRALYALPVLFLLARNKPIAPSVRWLALAGGLLFGIDLVCWHGAIERIGAGLATVMANTQVVWVALGAWVLQGERPTNRQIAVSPVLLGGVAMLAGLGDSQAFGNDPVAGTLLGLAGAIAYAGYLLVHRRACRNERLPIGQLRDATGGIAMLALVAGLTVDPRFDLTPSWPAHGWLLALALIVQVAAWLAISTALPRLPAVEASTMLLLQPIGSLAWGRLLLGETPSMRQWLGAALVLGGVAVVQLRGGAVAPDE